MKFQLQVGGESIPCEELKVSLYKDLLKSTYGEEPDISSFVETVCETLSLLTKKPYSFFEEMPISNLMSCFFQIRMNSIGDRTTINLNIDETKRTLELRLDWINEELLSFVNTSIKRTLKVGSVEIEMDTPSIKRLNEKIDEEYLYFVKTVKLNDRALSINSNQEAKNVTEKLPVKVTLEIVEYFEKTIKAIKELNFLAKYGIKEHALGFIPSIESLLWFTKLMFNESLQSFYDNVFYLAKLANIPPSFIEKCSVGEYFVYTGILRRTLAQQNSEKSQDSPMLSNDEMDDFPEE